VFFDGCFMKSNSNKHAGYIKLFNEEKKNNPNRNYVMFIENLKVKTLTLSIDCLQAFKENIDKLFAINLNKQLIYYAKLQNITEGTFQGFKDKLVQWVTENRIEIFKQCPCSVYDQFQKTEPLLYLKLKTSLYDSCSIKCNLKVNYSGSSSKKSTKQDDQVTSVKKKQDKLEKSEEKSSSDEKKYHKKSRSSKKYKSHHHKKSHKKHRSHHHKKHKSYRRKHRSHHKKHYKKNKHNKKHKKKT